MIVNSRAWRIDELNTVALVILLNPVWAFQLQCFAIWNLIFCHFEAYVIILFWQLPFVDFLNHDVSCKSFLSFDQENNYAEVCIDFVPTFPISPKHIFNIFLSLPFWKDLKQLGVLCNHVVPFNTAPCNHKNIVCV